MCSFVQAESLPLIAERTVALDQARRSRYCGCADRRTVNTRGEATDVEAPAAVFSRHFFIRIDGWLAHVRLNPTSEYLDVDSERQLAEPFSASGAGGYPTGQGGRCWRRNPRRNGQPIFATRAEVQDNSGATPAAVAVDASWSRARPLFERLEECPRPSPLTVRFAAATIPRSTARSMAGSQVTTEVSIDSDRLLARNFAQLVATIASGKLSAKANVQTHFANEHFNVHASGDRRNRKFRDDAPREREKPVQWESLSVAIGQFDLAAHQATVSEVRSNGMHLFASPRARREIESRLAQLALRRQVEARDRARNEANAARGTQRMPRKPGQAAAPPCGAWQYQIASVAIDR